MGAWAVINPAGEIEVASVSATERAAIANWLVTEHGCPVYQNTTDDDINLMWIRLRGAHQCVQITCTRSVQ